MARRIADLYESLRGALWFVPALCVASAVVLAQVLLTVDAYVVPKALPGIVFGGGAEAAREILSTVASAMLQLTGLVFTITIVVLQLASTQFSPRVLRQFLRSRTSQWALGVFVSTFAFALAVLRSVRGPDNTGGEFIPAISVTFSLALVLLSVALFVHYINDIAQSIRVVRILGGVATETRGTIEHLFPQGDTRPDEEMPTGAPAGVITSPVSGTLTSVDERHMVEYASRNDACLVLLRRVGDFVCEGEPYIEVYGAGGSIEPDRVRSLIGMNRERTMQQDVAFGFRQLVDVAEKALSPSLNDPSTAVQALDHLHDLLRRLALRPFPSGRLRDDTGALRLVIPQVSWEGLVRLAVDEIRLYGGTSLQVGRRLCSMLEDLLVIAPLGRQEIILEELDLVRSSMEERFEHPADRERAGEPDRQGMGA